MLGAFSAPTSELAVAEPVAVKKPSAGEAMIVIAPSTLSMARPRRLPTAFTRNAAVAAALALASRITDL
jgi:hypothetical protein